MSNPAHQDELPLKSVLSHALFPGRVLLAVPEVAHALGCVKQHIYTLIESGQITAIDIGNKCEVQPGQINPKRRPYYRIPVAAFDSFIKSRSTTV